MIYLITYNFSASKEEEKNFREAIKRIGAWWNYLDDTWLVESKLNNASIIYEQLKPYIESKGHVIVIKVANDYQGWLPSEAWDWLKSKSFN